ncbi:MAG TPA: 3-phosphoshikimate 1-carboxyvinyltransferase [Blastocatellia bacterium]|nr:3-phosphoshikimate 1-carboxyvinyltransferase [Blastocatellia bacterium]
MKIQPAKSLRGTLNLPGDKSISHRAAMFGGIAEGITRVNGFADSQDCQSTLDCLSMLGVEVKRENDTLLVSGPQGGLKKPARILDVGNSGTTARMLSGILAGQPFMSELTGDESIQRRPMQRIIDPLTQMGAKIESNQGRVPLKISGGDLKPITYRLPVASAQVKSCILLAGLLADGWTTVIESVPTRNHTELMLKTFGANLSVESVGEEQHIKVSGKAALHSQEIFVPGDVSSAAFFICAALMVPNSEIILKNIGLNPTRTGLIDFLIQNGAAIEILEKRNLNNEMVGDLRVRHSRLIAQTGEGFRIGSPLIANLMDEIPILAILATQSDSDFLICDATELRHKETDRIATIVEGLRAMGAKVDELPDGLIIPGKQTLTGALINSHGDHRIAMAFAIAALVADGPTEIIGAASAAVSFPEFFNCLNRLVK